MMSYDPQFYSKPGWRSFRAAYLARHPICAVPGCRQPATVVDHVIRRSAGGPDYPPDSGLNGLCASHHNRKTRMHDQRGKTGIYRHEMPGCDANGIPLDPQHHWAIR